MARRSIPSLLFSIPIALSFPRRDRADRATGNRYSCEIKCLVREWMNLRNRLQFYEMLTRDLSPVFLPPTSLGAPRHNLPIQVTSFVGREGDIAQVKRLLNAARLVTLTGSGGAGKTRLALQVAGEVLENFYDGVWLIELAPLSNPGLVPQTVATALGVPEQPGLAIQSALLEYLRDQNILLILDNCEHLIEATAQLADAILHRSPHVKILATSREPLGIAGETPYIVPSLSLPDARHVPDAETLAQFDAVRLFVERATLLQPTFRVTEENAPAIAQVCDQLDGIPLALELAAARIEVLSVEQIARRLDDRFHLLTSGSRTVLPRQQTLRGAMDWSYSLLTEAERILLRRLSVFIGGWSLEAAEQIGSDADAIRREDVLDLLTRLVAKSLVRTEAQGTERRYHLLETIRQYAHEKLGDSGESQHVQNRHLEFFVRLAEEAESLWRRAEQVLWLNRLELEHGNLRAALAWSQTAQGNAEAGIRLAAALAFFWAVRGYLQEGRDHLMAVLEHTPSGDPKARAKAFHKAGFLTYMQSDYVMARGLLDESLALYRDLGPANRRDLAETLVLRGYMESEVGEYAIATELIQQGLGIMRELKDEDGIANALRDLGGCALRAGDDIQAVRYLEEALSLSQLSGNQNSTAIELTGLAEIALRQGDYERATALEQESLALRRKRGDKWGIAVSLGNLAWALLKRGDLEQTVALLQESVTLRREIGDPGGIAWCLEKLAQVALLRAQSKSVRQRRENFQRAARLLGAAAAVRAPSGSVVDLVDKAEYERQLSLLRQALPEATFAKMWAQGQKMTLGQAIEYAFPRSEPTAPVAGPLPTARGSQHRPFGGLTARQRQVAVLIAHGKSNRAIAVELVVSERTVENHVANIMSRLSLTSRTQIAMWAVEQGLTPAAGYT